MTESITNRFEYGAKIVLYLLAGFLPLFFLPWPVGIEFGREVVLTSLVVVAGLLWFLSVLTSGEIRFPRSPAIYAALLMLVVFSVSTFFSKSIGSSMFFADPAAEKLTTLLLGLFAMIVVAGVLKTRAEVGSFTFILIFAGAVSALLTAIQLLFNLPIYNYLNIGGAGIDFNVIGTINGLALFYLVLFVLSLGYMLSRDFSVWKGGLRWVMIASAVLFLLDILLIGFWTAWVTLLVTMVVMFALMFQQARLRNHGSFEKIFNSRYWIVFGVLMLSVVMMLLNRSIWQPNLSPEVHPSFRATYQITHAVFKEGIVKVLLGSGPGTFDIDWSLYKDPSINQTVFWAMRFSQGASWLATMPATAGLLGLISFLLFLCTAVYLFLKNMLLHAGQYETHGSDMHVVLFGGLSALIISLFLYVGNLSILILFFAVLGLLMSILAMPTSNEHDHFWSISEISVQFKNPWAVFLSSLAVVFLLSVGVAALYYEIGRLRVAFLQLSGVSAFNAGKIDDSIHYFEQASNIDDRNFLNYNNLVQVRAQQIRNLIQRASAGQNVQQEFQDVVSRAVQDSRKTTDLNPTEPVLWRNQAALYELILPFIPGAEQFAFAAYQKAIALDPKDPAIYVEWGRTGLVLADRLQVEVNRLKGDDQKKAIDARTSVLQQVEAILQKGADAKSDFAPAHFMLAQTALRLGNVQSAIRSTENAKLAAPFDIGIAFQLGLLYYQNNNLDQAQSEFERAVSLNGNYSNARYFLGLILDRKGDKPKAIAEFEKIQALNPDNAEVKQILANLRAGKKSLDGIVPPAAPPEKRKDTPIKEDVRKR